MNYLIKFSEILYYFLFIINRQAPKISTFERKYSVNQGGDFELTCEVSGTPYPTVVWSIVSLFDNQYSDNITNYYLHS